MKRFVAGSLARGLSNRGGGYISTAEMMARPGSMQGVMMNKQQSQQYYYWSRMMSSVAEKSKEVVNGGEVEAIKEEEKKKKNGDEMKGMVNSYWGLSRPSIKRPDGTDWPWNCFMVIITFLSFSFGDFVDHCVLVNDFFFFFFGVIAFFLLLF